ncbi:MAG: hypothetical protein AAGE52_35245 [Myxococcota bacterium]
MLAGVLALVVFAGFAIQKAVRDERFTLAMLLVGALVVGAGVATFVHFTFAARLGLDASDALCEELARAARHHCYEAVRLQGRVAWGMSKSILAIEVLVVLVLGACLAWMIRARATGNTLRTPTEF